MTTPSLLSKRAMLVSLSIPAWKARKLDKTVTGNVASQYNVSDEVGRYTKALVSVDAMKPITQAISAARKYHYDNTLPWGNDHSRLLPAMNFMDYSKEMRRLKTDFESAVNTFVNKYGSYMIEAQTRLNGMYDQGDYPDANEIADLFDFVFEIKPVPDAADFRVALGDADVEAIRADIEAKATEGQHKAMADLWKRLYESVNAMFERLSVKDQKFNDSLVGNMADLCALLPKLNIMDDPQLEAMRQDVETRLCGYLPQNLRKDMAQRTQAANDAADILRNMQAHMGGATV